MGYFYECLVTTLKFENNERVGGESKSFVFGYKFLFAWQHEGQIGNNEWHQVAEGLWVNIDDETKRELQNPPRYNIDVWKNDIDNRYEFQQNYTPKSLNSVFYYLVLPEYCYVDEVVIKNAIREHDARLATIYTRERNQCIGIVFNKDFLLKLSFALDEREFNNIRNERQPKIFTTRHQFIDPPLKPIFDAH